MIRTLCLGLAVTGMAACHNTDDADSMAVVKQFFAAAESGDCGQMAPIFLPAKGQFEESKCKELVEDFKQKQVHLLSLGEPKVDGRDKNARMIPASLSFKGGPHSWQMRAEKHDGKWQVRF